MHVKAAPYAGSACFGEIAPVVLMYLMRDMDATAAAPPGTAHLTGHRSSAACGAGAASAHADDSDDMLVEVGGAGAVAVDEKLMARSSCPRS